MEPLSLPSWDKVGVSWEMKCDHLRETATPVGWMIEKFSCFVYQSSGRDFAWGFVCEPAGSLN